MSAKRKNTTTRVLTTDIYGLPIFFESEDRFGAVQKAVDHEVEKQFVRSLVEKITTIVTPDILEELVVPDIPKELWGLLGAYIKVRQEIVALLPSRGQEWFNIIAATIKAYLDAYVLARRYNPEKICAFMRAAAVPGSDTESSIQFLSDRCSSAYYCAFRGLVNSSLKSL